MRHIFYKNLDYIFVMYNFTGALCTCIVAVAVTEIKNDNDNDNDVIDKNK